MKSYLLLICFLFTASLASAHVTGNDRTQSTACENCDVPTQCLDCDDLQTLPCDDCDTPCLDCDETICADCDEASTNDCLDCVPAEEVYEMDKKAAKK